MSATYWRMDGEYFAKSDPAGNWVERADHTAEVRALVNMLAMFSADHYLPSKRGDRWIVCRCGLCKQFRNWLNTHKEYAPKEDGRG